MNVGLLIAVRSGLNPCVFSFLLTAFALWSESTPAAEKPVLDRLFPAGGRAGSSVEVSLSGKLGDSPVGLWSDRGQLSAMMGEKNDKVTITVPADATPGTHWIRFHNSAGATAIRAFVVGNSAEYSEVEPNNRIMECSTVFEVPCVLNGVLEKAGDVDIFTVKASAGQTLVASVLAHRDLASPMDSVLQLLDEHGNVLFQNDDDQGVDSFLAYRISSDGIYRIRIFAFPTDPNSSIQFAGAPSFVYRITVATTTVSGHSEPLAVQSNRSSDVFLRGWNLPAEGLRVHVAGEDSVSGVTGREQVSWLAVPSESPIPVSVQVVNHPVVLETAALRDAVTEFQCPGSVSGTISTAAEKDVWMFRAEPGTSVKLQVDARRVGSLLDPTLSVRSSSNTPLKDADDISGSNLDTLTDVKVPADGVLQIEVRDRFSNGGDRYYYLLTVVPVKPSVTLAAGESELSGASDKPAEIMVNVDRQGGFDRVLQFSIDGLPAGLQLEPVRSEKDGESSKTVKLKVSGSVDQPFSGPVRLVARDSDSSVEGSDSQYSVGYAIPSSVGSDVRVYELWLTWGAAAK